MREYWSNVYVGDEPGTVRVGHGKANSHEELWRYESIVERAIYAIHVKLKETSK